MTLEITYRCVWHSFRRRQDCRDKALRELADLPDPADLPPEVRLELDGILCAAAPANEMLTRVFEGHAEVCASCGGLCCLGTYSRWRLPDLYLVRPWALGRSSTVVGQRTSQLLWTVCRRWLHTRRTERRERSEAPDGAPRGRGSGGYCPHLAPGKGCELPPNGRPTVCPIYMCKPLRQALARDEMQVWRSCVKDLEQAENEAVRILRHAYGRTSRR